MRFSIMYVSYHRFTKEVSFCQCVSLSDIMKQYTQFICQEPYQSLSVLDYPNITDELIHNPTRYQALRNDQELLVLHITPVRNPGPQSTLLCQGSLETDLLPLMVSFSVTEIISMFFIEASGRDVVYRSRNCLQIVTNIFQKLTETALLLSK